MPILYLYGGTNGVPNLAATVTASSVNSGGGSAIFPLPSSLATSSYGLVTANAMSDGSYLPNGVNFFAVGSSQTIPGNPFGVGAQFAKTYWPGQDAVGKRIRLDKVDGPIAEVVGVTKINMSRQKIARAALERRDNMKDRGAAP